MTWRLETFLWLTLADISHPIKASTAAHEMSISKLTYASGTTGIVDGPLVDSSTEKVYVVVGDDANTSTNGNFSCEITTGCSGVF
jgi:hypothetical protein